MKRLIENWRLFWFCWHLQTAKEALKKAGMLRMELLADDPDWGVVLNDYINCSVLSNAIAEDVRTKSCT